MNACTTDEALSRLLEQGRARAAATDPGHARLWEALVDVTAGGKRFRPALVVTVHDALGGRDDTAAAQVGAAVELLHTAFVIHDDVIDGDLVRRGRPNVGGTFELRARTAGAAPDDAADFGRTAGILAGDLALTAAIRAVATCGASTTTVHRLLDLFDAALHTTAAGELADVRLSLGVTTASLAQSLAMERQKTSAYSFSLPLQAGAVLAGADEKVLGRLDEAGSSLGIAFQLADDLDGVFGDPTVTGKSTTSDLRTRKQTPLLAHARSTAEWPRIESHLGHELTEEELAEVRLLLTTSGSRRFVEGLARRQLEDARAVLEDLGVACDLVAVLADRPMVRTEGEVAA